MAQGPMPGVEQAATLLDRYYRSDAIRDRMLEFLGGSSVSDASAVYVVGSDGLSDGRLLEAQPVTQLFQLLDNGCEVERSLWDDKSLVIDLDIDYENFDSAIEAYSEPARVFQIMQPVVDAALRVLNESGVKPLHLVSGKGHHLVWAVGQKTTAFDRLARLGQIPASLAVLYQERCYRLGRDLSPRLARAFAGAGMLLEFIAHRILIESTSRCSVPVQITAVEVGPGPKGREIVSLDISEYGDPLYTRRIRIPFSAYLKPRRLTWCVNGEHERILMPLFGVPLADMPITEALQVMRDPDAMLDLGARVSTQIPDHSESCLSLLDTYERSDLAAFHRSFYSEQPAAPKITGADCKGIDDGALPPCTRCILDNPNDWLLKPVGVQHVTRMLLALGWGTHDIVDAVRERFEADAAWRDSWIDRDRTYRALFYVRLFAGLIAVGLDQLIDLNCVSHKEKGYCPGAWCSYNLADYQNMLRRRNGG
jgi:hypothetical protein